MIALLGALILGAVASRPPNRDPVWGSKPILAHLLLDPQSASQLQADLDLTLQQRQDIVQVACQEDEQIASLKAISQAVIDNPALTRTEKADWVAQSGYNQQIDTIIKQNQEQLFAALGADLFDRLVDWIETHWQAERALHQRSSGPAKILARLISPFIKTYPRSFEVYATRYDAGERKIVALPDKCLKFANGSALRCDGYGFDQAYSVAISYEGNLVVALVGESGPWNVDDNYWSKPGDPQPRRMFADLPLGVPEAQAAYFDGYNGGQDQFGRTVTSPVAIDISRSLAADLGLGPGNNKVTVSYLWTEGWDSSPDQPGQPTQPGQITAAPLAPPIAWQTAAPNPDGAVIHTVQPGQTLVGIAAVYELPLGDLLALNSLTMQSVIQPGQQIVIKTADPTRPPTATATFTLEPSATRRPPSTPTRSQASTPASNQASLAPPVAPETRVDPILVVMLLVLLAGAGLLAWGVLIQRRKS